MERRDAGKRLYRNALCLLLALYLCVAAAVAQDSSGESESITEDYNQGWLDGHADAEGSGVWILSGLLLGPIGIILPWVINPKVPGARLIGKSVGYVEGYTAGYRQKAKPKNFYFEGADLLIYFPQERRAFRFISRNRLMIPFAQSFIGLVREDFGLSDAGFLLRENRKRADILITIWTPPRAYRPYIGEA
jgi:hypothetical protein